MMDLNRRNTETFEMALKDLYGKVYAQASRLIVQENTIAALTARMASLEQTMMRQQARLSGHGPTVT